MGFGDFRRLYENKTAPGEDELAVLRTRLSDEKKQERQDEIETYERNKSKREANLRAKSDTEAWRDAGKTVDMAGMFSMGKEPSIWNVESEGYK